MSFWENVKIETIEERFRWTFSYAVLEKWIFKIFWGPFYDDVINKDDSYVWSNEELKIKLKDLNLILVTFWNLLAVKCLLENYSNEMGLVSPIRQPGG